MKNQVSSVRSWLFTPKARFADLAALNEWLYMRCDLIASPGFIVIKAADEFAQNRDSVIDPYHDGYVHSDSAINSLEKVFFRHIDVLYHGIF